jgi:class 3 adenylate cyclase/predicted ATPase
MQCPSCRTENADSVKFCNECGAALKRVCPTCSAENPASAKFCGQCASRIEAGRAFPPPPAPPTLAPSLDPPVPDPVVDGERKLVTALFADIKDSVELMLDLDAEEAQAILDPALRMMVDAVRAYEGYVVQTTGDGIFALFGAPAAYQDHPRRCIYAALEMQRALRSYAERLEQQNKPLIAVRVGINTGEVVVRALDTGGRLEYNSIGHVINFASRLQAVSPPGSIAIGAQTRQLVEGYFELRPLSPMPIKGLSNPIIAYEVVGLGPLRRHLQVSMRRGLSKFVGRDKEMRLIQDALERAINGHGQIVTIVTGAGTGKSRLVYEFSRTLPVACKILDAYAVSHGKGMPWMPVIDLLQGYFDIRHNDDAAIRRGKIEAALAGLVPSPFDALPYLFGLLRVTEGADPLRQMDPLVRRKRLIDTINQVILAESGKNPLVLVFEDVHWADEQSRLLLDALADSIKRARILILVTFRPEYVWQRGGEDHFIEIRLDPLSVEGAEDLLASLLPDTDQLGSFKRFIIDKTAGNPFFIEEIIHSLFQDGTLLQDGSAVALTKPLSQLRLPQTVQGTLAERIDKLPIGHKEFLQTLAVIGSRLPLELILDVCGQARAQLNRMLSDLERTDFIYPLSGHHPAVYSFKHALTQEVTYNTLLSERRKRLHERVAETIEEIYAGTLGEHVSQLAHHYSRTDNVHKAIDYLGQAGEVAVQRSAHTEAAESLNAAIRLVQTLPDSSERAAKESRFWLALGVSLQTSMGYAASEVGAAYERSRQLGERAGDRRQIVSAIRGHSIFSIVKADYKTAFRLGERLFDIDDERQEYASERLMVLGLCSAYTGQFKSGKDYFSRALVPESESSNIETIQYSGHSRALCLSYHALNMWYLGYPDRALQYSKDGVLLAQTLSIPITLAQAQGMFGLLSHTRRDFSIAEEWIDKTIAYATEQGFPYWYTLGSILKGWMVAHESEKGLGIQQFEDNLKNYRLSGAKIGLPWFLALRSEIFAENGQLEEALLSIEEALSIMQETNERYHEAEIYRLRGEFLLRQNETRAMAAAEAQFQRSMNVARSQEAKSLELRTASSFARLRAQQGRFEEGADLLSTVYSWFTEGFDTPDLRDARHLLDVLSRAGTAGKS